MCFLQLIVQKYYFDLINHSSNKQMEFRTNWTGSEVVAYTLINKYVRTHMYCLAR